MIKQGLFSLILSTCLLSEMVEAQVKRPDHLFVYNQTQNKSYQCSAYMIYVEFTFSSLWFNDCIETSTTNTMYGTVLSKMLVEVVAYAPNNTIILDKTCLFVSHVDAPTISGGGSSTVIDCRSEIKPSSQRNKIPDGIKDVH